MSHIEVGEWGKRRVFCSSAVGSQVSRESVQSRFSGLIELKTEDNRSGKRIKLLILAKFRQYNGRPA